VPGTRNLVSPPPGSEATVGRGGLDRRERTEGAVPTNIAFRALEGSINPTRFLTAK